MKASDRLLPDKLRGRIAAVEGFLTISRSLIRSHDSAMVMAVAEYQHELTIRLAGLRREADVFHASDKPEAAAVAGAGK